MTTSPDRRIGAARVERALAVVAGGFGLLYALQTLDSFVADWPSMAGPLGIAVAASPALGVLLGLAAAIVPAAARGLFTAAAAAYVVGALLWPLALHGPVPTASMPWFVALWITPVTGLAVACRRALVPLLASVVAGVYLPVVLVLAGGDPLDAAVNGVFVVALSAVLVLLFAAVRRGVDRADLAQRAALAGFAASSADEATEAERSRTDALVHDSVLTTFLSAAAADTDEAEDLARRMAANALRVLSHVTRSAEHGPAVALASVLARKREELAPLHAAFEFRMDGAHDVVLPAEAAESLVAAMVQAMTNSVQHAGAGARRRVHLTRLGPDGARIVVEDDGIGFDPSAPSDRLGLRVSVVERLRLVDGRADVVSAVGAGCEVVLSWGSVVVSGTAPLDERIGAVTA